MILLAVRARDRRVGVLACWLRSGITQRLLAPPEPDPDQAARARTCSYPPTACAIHQWLTGKSLFGILGGLEYADKALSYRLIQGTHMAVCIYLPINYPKVIRYSIPLPFP